MKKKRRNLLLGIIIACIGYFVVLPLLAILTLHCISIRSQPKFDMLLEKLNEGMPFSEVKQILGEPGMTFTDQNDIKERGNIKDSKIIEECNLHFFGRLDVIPHTFILVYEDKKNRTVRLVTTKGM